jgi:hypothetical protein
MNRVTANRKGLGLNRATRKYRQTEGAFKQEYLADGKGGLPPAECHSSQGGKPPFPTLSFSFLSHSPCQRGLKQ